MVANTALMSPKKKNQRESRSESYRKPHKAVRIRIKLAEAAELVAESLAQDLTQYVNDALRERLQREGHWPPKLD